MLGFVAENDSLTGTDRNYTSGIKLLFTTGAQATPQWIRAAAHRLPGIGTDMPVRGSFALSSEIYTPRDIESSRPLRDQRPYAGLLYGSLAVIAQGNRHLDAWSLDFGMLGPAAGGENLQNSVHEWLGSVRAAGWSNQLANEPVVAVRYERQWRAVLNGAGETGTDTLVYAGASAGNLATYGQLGFSLRAGSGLASDFGPPRIRPAVAGTGWFRPRPGLSGYVFGGAGIRAVGYNVLLDGNTWTDSLSVEKKPFVADAQAGFVVALGGFRAALTLVYRSREFEGQEDPDAFGALSIVMGL